MRFTLDGDPFELTADLVRSRIVHEVPEPIREYWVEIDGVRWPVKQVVSLATGVTDRQRFQSQSSRRWLANLGFPIGSGQTGTSASSMPVALRALARMDPRLRRRVENSCRLPRCIVVIRPHRVLNDCEPPLRVAPASPA